ncbi:uncharacterized protein KY384_006546 [Bacidia gigantensis]|uniref:uncharacterized protein n=1 Tax=Bacidia gigantensis TaxID=2732470 RepID=UPI001D05BF99|nr:uncharacterized protein KY384_006546 [Bacidia gigantensis]KAG8528857.1 hypothetical protein KY384_006546 [Bacidia gigantensis]
MAESSPTSTSLTDQTPQSTSSSSSTADVLPKEIDVIEEAGILSLRKTKSKASVISRRVRQAVFDTGAPTVVDSQGQKILSFTFNDPDDPRNWPKAATLGPQLGPLISGFLAPFSWRWVFWTGLIVAGLSFLLLAFLPETYGPVILKWRAKRLREDTSDHSIYAALEVEYKGVRQLLTVTLWRPLNMLLFEAIVLFSSLYTALAYALFYTTFEAFPLIFTGIYGMTPGVAGLAYVPMFIGGIFAFVAFTQYDTIFLRAQRASKPWSQVEEYRRLPLACLGGPAYVVSLFWIGWTAHRQIHWSVPMVAGIFFGFGYMLILMALLNYITDAYEIYAASGMAAASFSRSILGALLPIAAKPMYEHLGIAWGNSLLAFFSLGMCVIPFAFIRYGDSIRANSKICSELKERERPISMGVPHASELTADFHAVGECANIPDNDLEVRTVGLITA